MSGVATLPQLAEMKISNNEESNEKIIVSVATMTRLPITHYLTLSREDV